MTTIYFNILFDPHIHFKHFLCFYFIFFPGCIRCFDNSVCMYLTPPWPILKFSKFFVYIRVLFNFCSISLTVLSKFLMSVSIVFSLLSNWSWVCSRLLVSSVISVDNVTNRSFVDFIFEFLSSLIAALWAASLSFSIVLMVSRRIWSFSCGRVAISVSGVGVNH